MLNYCNEICVDGGPRRNSKSLRGLLHRTFVTAGIKTNSKLADVIPGWAEEILAVSIGSGHYRYRDISYYFVALCVRVGNLNADQAALIARDPSPLSAAPVTTMIREGKDHCDSLGTGDLAAAAG